MNAELTRVGRRLVLRCDDVEGLRDVANALPAARWSERHQAWSYPATLGMAVLAHNALNRHAATTFDGDVLGLLSWARAAADARAFRTMTLAELPPLPTPKTYAWWEHQARAFHWALAQESAMLFMGMGSGKSRVCVELVNAWDAKHVLIMAGKRALRVWPKQFRLHSLADYHVTRGDVFSVKTGRLKKTASPAERVAQLELELAIHERVVVLVNYEMAWREPFRTFLLTNGKEPRQWHVVALDEGHRVSSSGGKQSLMAHRLRDCALGIEGGRRLELTGSAMRQSGLDLYGQGRFLDVAYFGTDAAKFRRHFGKPRVLRVSYDVNEAGDLIEIPHLMTLPGSGEPVYDGVLDERRDEMAGKLASMSFHVSSEDAVDLPPALDHDIEVVLDAKTSTAYRQLERDFVAEFDRGTITIDNALTKMLRLQQVTSGHLPLERECGWCDGGMLNGRVCTHCEGLGVTIAVETIGREKADALAELLDDAPAQSIDPATFEPARNAPLVVFCQFTADLLVIETAAQRDRVYRELSGGRDDAITEDGELVRDVDVAGVQIASGAEGLDFTRARVAAYFSLGPSLLRYDQSRARTRRPGADLTRPVEYVHFTAVLVNGRPTVDGDIREMLAQRKEDIGLVIDRMRERVQSGD